MHCVCTPTRSSQSRTGLAAKSLPLSLRMCTGTPRVAINQANHSSTSSRLRFLATSIDRHSRVHSSMTVSVLKLRPSCVWPCTKLTVSSRRYANHVPDELFDKATTAGDDDDNSAQRHAQQKAHESPRKQQKKKKATGNADDLNSEDCKDLRDNSESQYESSQWSRGGEPASSPKRQCY